MAALVQTISQTISQPISAVTMLQTRPATSSGPYSTNQSRSATSAKVTGNIIQYRPTSTSAASGGAAYALNQIPGNNQNPLRQHPVSGRFDSRTMSAPGGTLTTMPTPSPKEQTDYLKTENRLSLLNTPLDLSLIDPRVNDNSSPKHTPERYKRSHKRSETGTTTIGPHRSPSPSGSGMAAVAHLYNLPAQSSSIPGNIGLSKDDSAVTRTLESAKRYRRRSIATIANDDDLLTPMEVQPQPGFIAQPIALQRSWASVVSTPYVAPKPEIPAVRTGIRPSGPRPSSSTARRDSNDSLPSASSIKKEPVALINNNPTVTPGNSVPSNQLRVVNIPPRGSSDATKRLTIPSPLSQPISPNQDQPPTLTSFAKLVSAKPSEPEPQSSPIKQTTESPAQQQLASLSKKEGKKDGKPSRLRRAFSFGSAAELRKASAENNHAATTRKLQKPQYETEEEAREAAIVQQQEASGLGNSIYSGQGNVFSGSTDNLSVSSTASSASIMLRKMGKGMKKGTRSFVGLFRPKSVIGVPAADAAVPEPALAEVSMVTVEAEREKVNVNLHPSEQAHGGTGYPKLERNSLDTAGSEPSLTTSDRSSDGVKSRRSIVGSEKDRAEVLAAVKKGILKRAGTDPGSSVKSPEGLPLPQLPQLPRFGSSPQSSAPGTPDEGHSRGHRRTDSVTIEGEDYFIGNGPSFTGVESKSLPGTPKSSARNITFSPRIQFHDTWTAVDYDRRGEIATCNRLTPSLAQAIKEELNTFKMEMEVHESSKVYTHFF